MHSIGYPEYLITVTKAEAEAEAESEASLAPAMAKINEKIPPLPSSCVTRKCGWLLIQMCVHWVNPWTNTLPISNSPRFSCVLLPQNWVNSNIESVFVFIESCTQCSIYADKMEFTLSQSVSFVICTCVIKWWSINIKRHCAILVTIDQSIVIIIIITCLLSMVRPFIVHPICFTYNVHIGLLLPSTIIMMNHRPNKMTDEIASILNWCEYDLRCI